MDSKAKMTIRATAMRTADTLSRLYGISPDKPEVVKRGSNVTVDRFIVMPPSSEPSQWPVIDADPLLYNADDEARFILPDDGNSPSVWPVNGGVIFPKIDSYTRIAMIKTIDPASVRGKVKLFSANMAWMGSIDIDDGGKIIGYGSGVFSRINRKWVDAVGPTKTMPHHGHFSQGIVMGPSVMIGHILRQRYEWSAVFHFPTGLRLRYGCSSCAVLELFKDREKDDGKSRRLALLHWVRRHWRQSRFSQANAASEVRKHLRGQTLINWRGMDVTIVPAMFEVEQAT